MATPENRNATAPVALITGGSRGPGRAVTAELVRRCWQVIIDGRDVAALRSAVTEMPFPDAVTAIPGDVAEPEHRARLADAASAAGGLDLAVNNASILGPSPQPQLDEYPLAVLEAVYAVNTLAPVALLQLLLPHLLRRQGRVINVSSDAAVEAYEGWGGYGSSKGADRKSTR